MILPHWSLICHWTCVLFQGICKSLTNEMKEKVTAKAENLLSIIFLTRPELLPQIAFSLSFASSSFFSAFYNHLLRFVYQSSLSSEYPWFHPREHPLPPLLSKNGGILLGQPQQLRRLWKIKFNDSQRSTNISIHWDFLFSFTFLHLMKHNILPQIESHFKIRWEIFWEFWIQLKHFQQIISHDFVQITVR